MNNMKHLIKMSMRMLTEADSYSNKYAEAKMAGDSFMADLYHKLAQLHLDGYQHVKAAELQHSNQVKREDPKSIIPDMYIMVKETETDLYDEISKKLNRY